VTTSMENLLRVARNETAAGTAFAAILEDGHPSEIVSVPPPGAPEGLSSDELAALVHQAAADPEFSHARVFVRAVQLGQSLTLAVAPASEGASHGMIGVVAGTDHRFEPPQLEVLERLAERLGRHLQVVHRLSGVGFRTQHPGPQSPTSSAGPAGGPGGAPLDARPPAWAAQPVEAPGGPPSLEVPAATWWTEPEPLLGLSSLGQFFSRAGRMLASDPRTAGALALVVVEVPDPRTMPSAARALRAQLRFSDPLALVDRDLLAVAVVILPAGSGDAVEQRLGAAVRSVLERPSSVRTVHVMAAAGDRREVDELLREAVSRLPGRS
jgi:hypothetical protein